MNNHSFFMELKDICFKYERLESLISLLQMITAEMVDVSGIPEGSLNNALYEIETEMGRTNQELKELILQKGGIS